MHKCRCNEICSLDLSEYNIILMDSSKIRNNCRLDEYICLKCGYTISSKIIDEICNLINVTNFRYPREILFYELEEVLKELENRDVCLSDYYIYIIMKLIVYLYNCKKVDLVKMYGFDYLRNYIINFVLDEPRKFPFKKSEIKILKNIIYNSLILK